MSEIDPKLSRLYREAATEEPPAAVDAAILAAARKHAARPERRKHASWLSWMAPVSAVATLVVGVSIALLVERDQPAPARDMTIRPIAPRPQSAAPARASESVKANTAGSAAAAAKAEAAAPVPRPAAPPAPAAQAFPAESRAKASESRTMQESNVARDAAPGAAAPSVPAAAPAAGRLAPLRQPSVQRSPESWLEEIGRLKREGHDKEAARQLAEFRKAYPEHPVPEALLK